MILTALFPENRIRYLSRNIAIPYRCAFTRLPRNSGFDLRVAETLFYPTLFSNVSPLVHASRTTREVADKPGRTRERGGSKKTEDRETFEITLIRREEEGRFLLSGGSLGYQAEREKEFTGNFTPVRPAVEGKRGGLIPESTASGSKRSGTSSFPAKLDLVSRSSNASIPSFPFPSPPLLSSPSPFPRNKPSSLPRFRGD